MSSFTYRQAGVGGIEMVCQPGNLCVVRVLGKGVAKVAHVYGGEDEVARTIAGKQRKTHDYKQG